MNSTLPEPDAFEANLPRLVAAYAAGLVAFALSFATTFHWTRHIHATHNVSQVPELTLIKFNTRLLRILCLVLLSIQLALCAHAMSMPDSGKSSSFFDSLGRPLGAMLGLAFGFSTNLHASFRIFVVFVLLVLVALDTVSEVRYVSILSCGKKGAVCSASAAITPTRLKLLAARDLVAIAFELWSMLVTAFLSVSIGICVSRYSHRQLSIRNPYSNIRDLLAKQHPELSLKHTV
ncbi:Aste57867_10249 [Aphanomyces stellatus]|uniref:Aste57867_10249 protein n=1 Tax=Aphanomyces stellatus TaxID=120398 RepID=A0A485KQI8_9STRA|nr:hypothetical protein As57867_010210 [Aphanomyces stellatus]VFT87124.1 Aste57867_10249 [Aphanomyces stellatus]